MFDEKERALFMPKGNEAVGENRSYPYLRSTVSISYFHAIVNKIIEDLPQVNPQLCKWLATINGKSSTNSIPETEQKSNSFMEKSRKILLPNFSLFSTRKKRKRNFLKFAFLVCILC